MQVSEPEVQRVTASKMPSARVSMRAMLVAVAMVLMARPIHGQAALAPAPVTTTEILEGAM
jgi:hypothetical protein